MEVANPVYDMSDNEKPPVYEYRGLGRSLDGVTSGNYYNVSSSPAQTPKHPKTSKSLKCILTVMSVAIILNLLLVVGGGGVLYHYHQRISDLEGGTSSLLGGSVGGLNKSGPPGPPGPEGMCYGVATAIDYNIPNSRSQR